MKFKISEPKSRFERANVSKSESENFHHITNHIIGNANVGFTKHRKYEEVKFLNEISLSAFVNNILSFKF